MGRSAIRLSGWWCGLGLAVLAASGCSNGTDKDDGGGAGSGMPNVMQPGVNAAGSSAAPAGMNGGNVAGTSGGMVAGAGGKGGPAAGGAGAAAAGASGATAAGSGGSASGNAGSSSG